MRWAGAFAIAALALAAGPLAGVRAHAAEEPGETPRIYRWIDENGVAHYTTDRSRIPDALRGRVPRAPREAPARPTPREVGEQPTPAPPRDVEAWATRDRRGVVPDDAWSEGAPADTYVESPAQTQARRAEARARIEELEEQIAALEAEVEADEDALKDLISDPESGGPLARSGDPEFRAIAQRLPQRLAELRALREERADLVTE